MTREELYEFQKLQEHADHLLEQGKQARKLASARLEEIVQLRAQVDRLQAQIRTVLQQE